MIFFCWFFEIYQVHLPSIPLQQKHNGIFGMWWIIHQLDQKHNPTNHMTQNLQYKVNTHVPKESLKVSSQCNAVSFTQLALTSINANQLSLCYVYKLQSGRWLMSVKSDMEADSIDKDLTVLREAGSQGETSYSLSVTGTERAQTTCDGQELNKTEIQRPHLYHYSW